VGAFVAGFGQAFGGPAYSALIPTLVPKEDIPNAIALNSIQFNAAVAVGPAFGGLALHALGATWCFGLNTLSFFAPIVALLMLHIRFLPEKTEGSILDSMKQGIHFIRKQGAMQALIVLGFLMALLAIPMRTFLPVFADKVLHMGSGTFAALLSMSGAGSVVGALIVAYLGNVKRKGYAGLVMLMCLGAGITGFSLSRSILFSCVMLFFSGASMMAVFSMVMSLVQLVVSNQMRGRVISVYNLAFRAGMPLGNGIAGTLVPIFTAPKVLAVNGILLVGLGLFYLLVERQVAELSWIYAGSTSDRRNVCRAIRASGGGSRPPGPARAGKTDERYLRRRGGSGGRFRCADTLRGGSLLPGRSGPGAARQESGAASGAARSAGGQ
jgi:predicted MFS family arabinose efflux permease